MRRARKHPGEEGSLNASRPSGPTRVLVVGIGNPGRRDDGLGARVADRLAALALPGVTCDANYQLNVEDALECSRSDIVIFVDASRTLRKPFALRKLAAARRLPAMTHSLGPEVVLALCTELYGRAPEAYLMAVRGRDWGLGEELSPQAAENLEAAVAGLADFLMKGTPARRRTR